MVELIVENQVLFYCAGIAIFLGIVIKMIVSISLKRLVSAASNMNKSNHKLMRLVRAKFEHACMVSDKVQNVQTFVEKYLYEYKVLGIRLYSLRQMEKTMIWLCAIFSVAGGVISYYVREDMLATQRYAAVGGAGVVLLVLLQITGNENSRLAAVKMYMVDFLENTYAHRYEKMARRENLAERVMPEPEPAIENEIVVEPVWEAEEVPPVKEPEVRPDIPPIPPMEPELQPVQAAKIREILEEFLT